MFEDYKQVACSMSDQIVLSPDSQLLSLCSCASVTSHSHHLPPTRHVMLEF